MVRRRHRCRDGSHGQAANPSRQGSRAPKRLHSDLSLPCGAVAVLALALNVKAAALLAFTIFFYVVVYTVWLKRRTPQNIVIGGAAGALPPVIGWAAATGDIGLEPLVLFLIIFLWTPPHFWALSLNRSRRICPRGRPHAAGRCRKSRNNAADPHLQRSFGAGFAAALGRSALPARSTARPPPSAERSSLRSRVQLSRSREADRRPAHRLFAFSIVYLFVLFAALLAGNSSNRWSSTALARAAPTAIGSAQAESPARPVRTARSSTELRADEV